jgi:DNA mismatch repair ATPase MutS
LFFIYLFVIIIIADHSPEKISFLYKLVEGAAQRSYGLNVARLADLPNEILVEAKTKSREMEEAIQARSSAKTGNPSDPDVSQQAESSASTSIFKDLIRLIDQDGDRVERRVLLALQKLLAGKKVDED